MISKLYLPFRSLLPLTMLCLATACSSFEPVKEARDEAVVVLPATYAVSTIEPNGVKATSDCSQNYGDIVGHLEMLMAQNAQKQQPR